MKEPNMFISLLILGPKGPSNDFDIYLQPLIDELKELWEVGAYTYGISIKQNFQMRVRVLWSVNDFPTCSNLLGWCTKGKLAFPCYASQNCLFRLSHGQILAVWIIFSFY